MHIITRKASNTVSVKRTKLYDVSEHMKWTQEGLRHVQILRAPCIVVHVPALIISSTFPLSGTIRTLIVDASSKLGCEGVHLAADCTNLGPHLT